MSAVAGSDITTISGLDDKYVPCRYTDNDDDSIAEGLAAAHTA